MSKPLFVLLLLLPAAPCVWADDPKPGGTLNLVIENDKFSGTDRHYTNGLQLSYLSPKDDVPALLRAFARILPGVSNDAALRAGFSVGHNIYTPQNTELTTPIPGDRPYAGWLYGGFAILAETEDNLSTWQLNAGVVGPSAQGEFVQNTFHDWIGVGQAKGWDNQLHDEAGVQLIYEHKWRNLVEWGSMGLGADLTPHAGASLGNVATYFNAGAMVRVGKDLRNDFGPPRIHPSLPGSAFFLPRSKWSWYLFGGVDGRAVAYNIFLDGNTDGDSLDVEKKNFVYDIQAGAAITIGRLYMAYTHVYRSREFDGQDRADRFGAISLSVNF